MAEVKGVVSRRMNVSICVNGRGEEVDGMG